MNVTEITQNLMKYWYKDAANTWRVADNAPSQLHLCVRSMPKGTDPNTIHVVFESVATKKPIPTPDNATLLYWVATSPDAQAACDEVLKHSAKNKCASLNALLAKAWNSYAYELLDKVHKYFS